MSQRIESGWRSTVAGITAAVLGTTVGHPMDTVKVCLQNREARGPIEAVRLIYRNEGIFAFFKGLLPPVLGRSVLKAINYGTYGATLAFIQRNFHETDKVAHPVSLWCRLGGPCRWNCRRNGWITRRAYQNPTTDENWSQHEQQHARLRENCHNNRRGGYPFSRLGPLHTT